MSAATFENAVNRPDGSGHFYVLKPVAQKVMVTLRDTLVGESDSAVWLMEGGKTLYPPVIYIPRTDVTIPIASVPGTTHCPLKGDATYFIREGDGRIEKIAWSYVEPFDFSASIAGLIAFDPTLVTFQLSTR